MKETGGRNGDLVMLVLLIKSRDGVKMFCWLAYVSLLTQRGLLILVVGLCWTVRVFCGTMCV